MYINTVYTLFKDQQSLHFTTAVHRDTLAVHCVGILFSGDANDFGAYCVYLPSDPHRLVKFPHNQELSFTPAEARAAWITLTKSGWLTR